MPVCHECQLNYELAVSVLAFK